MRAIFIPIRDLREHGFRATLELYGWKLFALIVFLYFVRDVFLYLIVPYLILQSWA